MALRQAQDMVQAAPPPSTLRRKRPRTPAAPFLKWAGGKSQLLAQLRCLYPRRVERYFEPFVGSGAVFFDLRQRFDPSTGSERSLRRAVLSDNNEELINCYRAVRDDVEKLIGLLRRHKAAHERDNPGYYYRMRDTLPRERVRRAARLIYLNKTGYNGLYRVNAKGRFNVPIGRYKNPLICDAPRLRAASAALQGVELDVRDFAEWLPEARPGDFFYIDPPYDPLSKTANFTSYTERGFGREEQERLAQFVRALDAKGCLAMVSNSDTPLIRSLYRGLRITRVSAWRAINSNGRLRGPISELVITNYEPGAS